MDGVVLPCALLLLLLLPPLLSPHLHLVELVRVEHGGLRTRRVAKGGEDGLVELAADRRVEGVRRLEERVRAVRGGESTPGGGGGGWGALCL